MGVYTPLFYIIDYIGHYILFYPDASPFTNIPAPLIKMYNSINKNIRFKLLSDFVTLICNGTINFFTKCINFLKKNIGGKNLNIIQLCVGILK